MIGSKVIRQVGIITSMAIMAAFFVNTPPKASARPLSQNCTPSGWTDTAPGLSTFTLNYIANPGSSWQHLTGQTNSYDETLSQINGGGKVTFDFYCATAITYVYKKGPDQGIARIFIGSTPVADVDLYSPTVQWQEDTLVYVGSQGTLSITRSGLKNPSSTGAGINIDALHIWS